MKKLVFLLLAVMMLTACGQDKENDQGAVYVNITAEEAKQIMDSEEGYIILDVRTQEEYDEAVAQEMVFKAGIADEDRWTVCENTSCRYAGVRSTFTGAPSI